VRLCYSVIDFQNAIRLYGARLNVISFMSVAKVRVVQAPIFAELNERVIICCLRLLCFELFPNRIEDVENSVKIPFHAL
jgi:hypothetical protein